MLDDITKEANEKSFVNVLQHGGDDVTCNRPIDIPKHVLSGTVQFSTCFLSFFPNRIDCISTAQHSNHKFGSTWQRVGGRWWNLYSRYAERKLFLEWIGKYERTNSYVTRNKYYFKLSEVIGFLAVLDKTKSIYLFIYFIYMHSLRTIRLEVSVSLQGHK
jgi:hypothetical protein